ncbi:MAG: sugar phosphate isomerase/epimerase [Candidatus Omnitrophica bacterium]|nr:sugar phosphate isomerase/epimerase [Candidatus Omnitrophota bacterium]MBU4478670.1 sugar phosphate isomerase/epimerase [Candidatus Omnitrophota bacterium]
MRKRIISKIVVVILINAVCLLPLPCFAEEAACVTCGQSSCLAPHVQIGKADFAYLYNAILQSNLIGEELNAKTRLKTAVERYLCVLLRKVLSEQGWIEAWNSFIQLSKELSEDIKTGKRKQKRWDYNRYFLMVADEIIQKGMNDLKKNQIPAAIMPLFEQTEQEQSYEFYLPVLPESAKFLSHLKRHKKAAIHSSSDLFTNLGNGENNKKILKELVVAQKAGAEVFVIHLWPRKTQWEDYARCFIPLAEEAHKHNIKLAVENCPCEGQWAHTAEDFKEFFKFIREQLSTEVYDNVYICFDVGHANVAYEGEGSARTFLERLEAFGLVDKIGHIHIHNNNGRQPHGMFWDTHSKQGTIDILAVLKRLYEKLNGRAENIFVTWEAGKSPFNLTARLSAVKNLGRTQVTTKEILYVVDAIEQSI